MGYTVNSVKKAWDKANEIFPGDYFEDKDASERAGYPIYTSAAKGSMDHISDLGTCLELNIGAESIQIHIDQDPEIEAANNEIERLKKALEEAGNWKPAPNTGTQMSQDEYLKWSKCSKVLTDEEAVEWICEELGFDPAKVKIIHEVSTYEVNNRHRLRKSGTYRRDPFYDVSDLNYVRFNVTGNVTFSYEICNGEFDFYSA